MFVFCAIILTVVCADQVSKAWIMQNFMLDESIPIIHGLFNLTYLTNNGAAFSILAGQPTLWRQVFFVGVACLALVFIVSAQRSFGAQSRVYSVSLGLIAGGALGNLIDRVHLGFVVDFLDVYVGSYHWPTFNVADSAITLGVILFIVKNLLFDRQPSKEVE